jgi:hypothetical protein
MFTQENHLQLINTQVTDYHGGLAAPAEIRTILATIPQPKFSGFLRTCSVVLEKMSAKDEYLKIMNGKIGIDDDTFLTTDRKV